MCAIYRASGPDPKGSDLSMATAQAETGDLFLEPKCNMPPLTRFCFAFFGMLGFSFGIAPS